MNSYRHLLNDALADTRAGNPTAATLLQRLLAEHRDIDRVIQHLERIQQLRSRRRSRFGTLDLSWTIRALQPGNYSRPANGPTEGPRRDKRSSRGTTRGGS